MPSLDAGRKKIIDFIGRSEFTITDFSVAYGVPRAELSDYIHGKRETAKGNQIILKIISDYKIR